MKRGTFVLAGLLFLFAFTALSSAVTYNDSGEVNFRTKGWNCVSDDSNARWGEFDEDGNEDDTECIGSYDCPFGGGPSLSGCYKDLNGDGNFSGKEEKCCQTDYSCVDPDGDDFGVCELKLECEEFDGDENGCNTAEDIVVENTLFTFVERLGVGIKEEYFSNPLDRLPPNCKNVTGVTCLWNTSLDTCDGWWVEEYNANISNPPLYTACEGVYSRSACGYIDPVYTDLCEGSNPRRIVNSTIVGDKILCDNDDNKGDGYFVREFPCTASLRLPFFTNVSFIISLMGIFLIYFLFRKKYN